MNRAGNLADLLAVYGEYYGDENHLPEASFGSDGVIGLSDLARLLLVYRQPCPTT